MKEMEFVDGGLDGSGRVCSVCGHVLRLVGSSILKDETQYEFMCFNCGKEFKGSEGLDGVIEDYRRRGDLKIIRC